MNKWSLVSGTFPTLISDTVAVVIGGDRAAEFRDRLLAAGGPPENAEHAISMLVADGFVNAPDFCVCSVQGDELTAVLRGALALRVEGDWSTSSTFDGRGVRTVREVAFEGVSRVAVFTSESDAGPDQTIRAIKAGAVSPGSYFGSTLTVEIEDSESMLTREIPRVGALPKKPRPDSVKYPDAFPDDLFGDTIERQRPRLSAVDAAPQDPGKPYLAAVPPAGAAPPRAPREARGTVLLPDGTEVPLAGTVLIGRSPRIERSETSELPTLIRVVDSTRDVSRTHVRVQFEDQRVTIEDFHSTNGTLLLSAEGDATELRPGELRVVTEGDSAILGGVVRIRFRGVS